jgi:hypothetical protein
MSRTGLATCATLWIVACAPVDDTAYSGGGPDYDAVCTDWVAADCLDGCSNASDELWAEGYMAYLIDGWGYSEESIRARARVRAVDTGPPDTTLWLQLEADWLVSLIEVRVHLPDDPTTISETKAAFPPERFPQVDLGSHPRSWEDVTGVVEDCEAELAVDFGDTGWCDSYVTMDAGDDDQTGVRYTHVKDLDDNQYAYATVYAWGGDEPDRCDQNQKPVE